MRRNPTAAEKRIIRSYMLTHYGAEHVHITADGTVSVFGKLPNPSGDGWYFAGWADTLLAIARAQGKQHKHRTEITRWGKYYAE